MLVIKHIRVEGSESKQNRVLLHEAPGVCAFREVCFYAGAVEGRSELVASN